MKKFYSLLLLLLFTILTMSQSPQGLNYQAVYRDVSGNALPDENITVIISILQGTVDGTEVFTETHTGTTNKFGLLNLTIGSVNTTDFPNIDWSDGPYYLKVDINGNPMGVTQLLSVPYALHSKTVESITETDPSVPTGNQTGDMQYWDGSEWVLVAATEYEGATLQMISGIPTWVGGSIPSVTNLSTGKIWMDRNLGASQVATSSSDANSYGDLYQWGRADDGHEIRTSNTTNILSNSDIPGHGDFIIDNTGPFYDWRNIQNDNLWQGLSGTNNPCPTGFRLPTEAEWESERQTWSSNDAAGAFAPPLKLPVAGYRDYNDGSIYGTDIGGVYWSSTVNGTKSRYLYFDGSGAIIGDIDRAAGCSVRCIKD